MFLSELIWERREEERGPTGRWAAGQTSRPTCKPHATREPPARPPDHRNYYNSDPWMNYYSNRSSELHMKPLIEVDIVPITYRN